jgi:2-dehydro-3-deoxyphosphogluconate aldolase / (4S)-4-hydroxy-2-oxoglutarate aldolase
MLDSLAGTVIPVVRTDSRASAELAVEWLRAAGVRTFELTLTTPDVIASIAQLARSAELTIGAGTVMDVAALEAVVAAGAEFVVSPILNAALVERANALGVPCICGALTPSEIAQAVHSGASAVKVFPVNAVGGASYIKSVRDVFPDVRFIPTGGIKVEQIADYLAAGAFAVGVGGELVNRSALASGNRDAIQAAARAALAATAL